MAKSTPVYVPARRRRANSVAAEQSFRARVTELGGIVVEPHWLGSMKPHRVVCPRGHECRPTPNNILQGHGMCRRCAGNDSASAEVAFRAHVADLGGQVIGQYVSNHAPVDCVCPNGHSCRPMPSNIRNRKGMCRTCAGQDTATAEAAFRARIADLGGQIVGEWKGSKVSVECVCPQGHLATPTPNCIQQGDGMCRLCARTDSAQAESAFRARVADLGGSVVGEYAGSGTPVDCRCPRGHLCSPRPTNIGRGLGMCRTCARQDPVAAKSAFYALIAERGGRVVGEYVNNHTPVACVCPAGHSCRAWPTVIQQGGAMCRMCVNMVWDVFYVTISPTLGRLKFGISSGDGRARLDRHRRAGYTEVIRILPGLPDAHLLERHILTSLRDAGAAAVHGREYFDIGVLAVVLDVVDGWIAA